VIRIAHLVAALALVLGSAGPAAARTEKTVNYAAAKVWPSAVRFLRVDEGLKIVEKDADAGYVMFELTEEKRTFAGALELVVSDDDSGPRVKIVIQIEDRPDYVEAAMIERLEAKLRKDLGSPPPRKSPPAPPPAEKKPAERRPIETQPVPAPPPPESKPE
jgi:hypothetical protein